MRALHVAAGNLYGGVERIVVEIGRARGTWTHEVALAFPGRAARELDAEGAIRHDVGAVRFSRPLTVWRARHAIKRLLRDRAYDAVVCHSPWSYALAAPRSHGLPRVLWAHDALNGAHWTEKRVARLPPDVVICNSQFTAASIRTWLPAVRTEVLYAPVSDPAVHDANARASIRAELTTPDQAMVIVIASRYERWKGHDVLLDAVARLRGAWRLWVAAGAQRDGEAEYARELQRRAAELGIADRVRFLGARDDVPRLLRGADVLCQPNTAPEPFGIAFVEALYAARPVVTSDAGGAREIVTNACGLLVAPGDTPALAAALQRLLDAPDLRHALGAHGPARARALCDPSTQVRQLESVLASCRPVLVA